MSYVCRDPELLQSECMLLDAWNAEIPEAPILKAQHF